MSSGLFVSDDEETAIKTEQEPLKPVPLQEGEDEDGDAVVEELPIYASVGSEVYLYQYPTRSAKLPFVDGNRSGVISGRIKPDSKHIAVDVPIGRSQFYDEQKGEKWDNIDRQTMAGVVKQGNGTYVIGVLDDNGLHMNEVQGVAQLRPQFNYFDKNVVEEREALKSTRDAVASSLATGKTSGEPRAVQMSAKSTNDFAPKFSGALSAKKVFDEEINVEIDWHDRDSNESADVRTKLIASNKEPLKFTSKAYDYSKELQE